MVNTFEIASIVILLVIFGIAIWWFIVAKRFESYLDTTTVARGANLHGPGNVNLSCQDGKTITVATAVQVCTDPDSNNYENPSTDPISTGLKSYGQFNPDTTVNLLKSMGDKCNGKTDCTYSFSPSRYKNGVVCGGESQLISVYYCSP